ncbi:MucBP domain-containing protein [uncultured Lactobacillus sp.]|uniref:MucBP domain-containing protein n=1 Tax=uncultured Lactobacillus sp. TaxID=153152 RepID=UPI0025FF8F5F|nr:MucBP domain-containing protein [uncultured Lactobacillus sp.]
MNSKSNCRHRGKLLFTSVAAATLGLIIMSPDMAKADTLVDSAAAKKQVAQSSSLPASNNNQTAASTDSAVANNNPASRTSEAAASNVAQPSTSPSSEAQDANELPAVGEEAKGITPRSVLTISWSGINVTLDTATDILTIPGGTVTNPLAIFQIFEKYYYDYKSLKKIKITGPLKIIGNAGYMFEVLSGLTEIEGFNQVDTSEVTNMYAMFLGCPNLSSLDLSSFNTTKVTNMRYMFYQCYSLTSLDLHSFDTSSVTGMNCMFYNCSKLSSLDLSNFDTAKVTDMTRMFFGCQSLKTLNISSFQMAQVTSKSEMLKSLPNLSTLVLGPNNYLLGTDLDATGVWLNVGNGTVDKPQGNKSWTSSQLMSNYSGSRDQDTYVRLGGAVTVHYRDETGATLAPDQILSGKIGDSYSSEPQDIAGYVVKTTPANAKGTYTDKVQEVTYVYTNQVKVLVHYVDQDGKPIAGVTDETLTGTIGDPYPDSAVKDIKGYTLKTKPTGKFSSTETEVTYVYAKLVTVIAHYVDQDGKPIAADETLNGKIGDPYPDSAVKDISGYTLKTKPTGKFSGTETEVTYIYAKLVTVIAHYVDQNGKPVAEDETLNGKIGDPYPDSAVKDISGYTLKTKPTGKFSSTETEVTYIYAKLVTAIAHYVDQDGKPIAGVTDEHLTGAIGDPYPDSAVKAIPGYTLKTKPTGKFSGTETEVTYVYTKNASVNPGGTAGRQPILGGSVTVHYQDETGKQLAPDQILTGNVGEGYLTQEVALAGYKLTQRPANATGFYTANPQSVTYIYTKNVTGQAAVRRTVFHNSYLYDQNGGRKTGKYLMGKTIWTYGTKVIQGKKYYDLGQDNYVKATNVSGVKRKLRRNSYIYSKTAKKLQRKALKRGQKVRTYGAAVKIHRKLYYIVGKNQYVKKSNF